MENILISNPESIACLENEIEQWSKQNPKECRKAMMHEAKKEKDFELYEALKTNAILPCDLCGGCGSW